MTNKLHLRNDYKDLAGMLKEHKSILKRETSTKKERKTTTFANDKDLVQSKDFIRSFN